MKNNMKTYEIIKNGTVQGTIKADNIQDAENIYIATYGQLDAKIVEI